MIPSDFPQATGTLNRPATMTDAECAPLRVHCGVNHHAYISCWRPTWRERFALLFGRPLWLWVMGGAHPPVALEVQNPFPEDNNDAE